MALTTPTGSRSTTPEPIKGAPAGLKGLIAVSTGRVCAVGSSERASAASNSAIGRLGDPCLLICQLRGLVLGVSPQVVDVPETGEGETGDQRPGRQASGVRGHASGAQCPEPRQYASPSTRG